MKTSSSYVLLISLASFWFLEFHLSALLSTLVANWWGYFKKRDRTGVLNCQLKVFSRHQTWRLFDLISKTNNCRGWWSKSSSRRFGGGQSLAHFRVYSRLLSRKMGKTRYSGLPTMSDRVAKYCDYLVLHQIEEIMRFGGPWLLAVCRLVQSRLSDFLDDTVQSRRPQNK